MRWQNRNGGYNSKELYGLQRGSRKIDCLGSVVQTVPEVFDERLQPGRLSQRTYHCRSYCLHSQRINGLSYILAGQLLQEVGNLSKGYLESEM